MIFSFSEIVFPEKIRKIGCQDRESLALQLSVADQILVFRLSLPPAS